MAGEHRSNHGAHQQLPTGFEISANSRQTEMFLVKKIKTLPVCLLYKLFLYTHLAQSNYGWDILNIAQTYRCGNTMTLQSVNFILPNARTRFYRSRSLQQGQRSHYDLAHLQPPTSVPTKYQLPTQDFIGQGHYGKVKSRSHHDVAHLQSLTNAPAKYQLPTPYGF